MQTISTPSLYCDGSYLYFIFDNVEVNVGQRNQEKADLEKIYIMFRKIL